VKAFLPGPHGTRTAGRQVAEITFPAEHGRFRRDLNHATTRHRTHAHTPLPAPRPTLVWTPPARARYGLRRAVDNRFALQRTRRCMDVVTDMLRSIRRCHTAFQCCPTPYRLPVLTSTDGLNSSIFRFPRRLPPDTRAGWTRTRYFRYFGANVLFSLDGVRFSPPLPTVLLPTTAQLTTRYYIPGYEQLCRSRGVLMA